MFIPSISNLVRAFLLLLFFQIASCTSTKSVDQAIPENYFLDVNEDGVQDFEINYKLLATRDMPSSIQTYVCQINPLQKNQLLINKENNSPFLDSNFTIKQSNVDSSEWSQYPIGIISKKAKDGKWEKNWQLVNSQKNPFFIGIQLNEATENIGYLKLEINIKSGKVVVKDVVLDKKKIKINL